MRRWAASRQRRAVFAGFEGFNDRLQLSALAYTKDSTKLLDLAYTYNTGTNQDNNGQIRRITDNTGTAEAGRTVDYTYDAWARLKTAVTTGTTQYAQWGLSWTYDRYSNRTQQSVTHGTGPSNLVTVSTSTNRVTSMGSSNFTYDDAGNLTKDDLQRYVYDGAGRQVKVRNLSDTADKAEYLLDGAGVRVKKCTPNCGSATATTVYVFSLAEYDDGAAVTSPTRDYILSGGALVATIEGSTTRYHHGDHLSRRVTTDTAGALVSQQGHHPFGEQWYAKDGSGSAISPGKLFFTSYERDSESGNDYAVFRSHMNRVGRFTSPDPIAGSIRDPQSLNRYAYVRNDPVNLTDPLGLEGGPPLVGCWSGMWTFVDVGHFDNEGGWIEEKDWYFVGLVNQSMGACMPGFEDPFEGWGGPGVGTDIETVKSLANAILNGANDCAELFAGVPPASYAGTHITRYKGENYFSLENDEIVEPTAARVNKSGPGRTPIIEINSNGAFDQGTAYAWVPLPVGPRPPRLPIGVGSFAGGTMTAQIAILLHEWAHIAGVIPSDAGNAKQSGINVGTIEKACKKAIEEAIRSLANQ